MTGLLVDGIIMSSLQSCRHANRLDAAIPTILAACSSGRRHCQFTLEGWESASFDRFSSSPSAASQNPGQPIAPAAPAAQPARQSRLWNAGGPAGLAALEARNAAERQAQLRHAPREAAAERSAWAWYTSEDGIHFRLDD
jgi:hypothetical protein